MDDTPLKIACVDFKTEYVGEKAVDKVLLAPVGEGFERTQTWVRIDEIKPGDDLGRMTEEIQAIFKARWALIGPQYEAWKKGEDVPENGTPLSAWSGLAKEQAEYLRRIGIRCVEDVATMDDATITKLPWPNRRETPKMAKLFIEGAGKAEMAKDLVKANERIAAMEQMLAEMQKEKRGPGRPRKAEAA